MIGKTFVAMTALMMFINVATSRNNYHHDDHAAAHDDHAAYHHDDHAAYHPDYHHDVHDRVDIHDDHPDHVGYHDHDHHAAYYDYHHEQTVYHHDPEHPDGDSSPIPNGKSTMVP